MAMISSDPRIEDRAVLGRAISSPAAATKRHRHARRAHHHSTILLHLPDGHDAEHVQQAIIDKMQHLPKLLRNSLTWDQGAELALHKRIGASLDMAVTSATRTPRGSAAPTRTPTGSCASTSQRHRPIRLPGGLRRGRRGTQRPATQTLGFMKPSEKIIELLDAA